MKKISAFIFGLISVPLALTLFIMMLIPFLGIIGVILTVTVSKYLYRWMVGKKPIDTITESGIEHPSQASLVGYKYGVLEIKLSFAAGLLTSYLLITLSNGNPDGTWFNMALIFLPVYIITIVMIVLALIKLSKITELPEWLINNEINGVNNTKRPSPVIRIATTATITAVICIPIITIGVNTNNNRRLEAIRLDREITGDEIKVNLEAEKKALLQLERDKQNKIEENEISEDLAKSILSENWTKQELGNPARLSYEYPSQWGEHKIIASSNSDSNTKDWYHIEFTAPNTPLITVMNGWIGEQAEKEKKWNVVKYFYAEKIKDTEYFYHIYFDKSEIDTCRGSCRAGKYYADLNKLVESFIVY